MLRAPTADLGALHDIVLPQPISRMPQTIGWAFLLVLVLVLAAWVAWRLVARHRANAYRREALVLLNSIEQDLATPAKRGAALNAIPELMKRTALAWRPREEVAALEGDAWLAFLDETSRDEGGFQHGPGRLLPTLAYAGETERDAIPREQLDELLRLARTWIRRHHVRA